MSEARTMFGKLFGRSRETDPAVLDSGLPSVTAAPVAPSTPAPLMPSTPGHVDLSQLMATVQDARAHAHGDPMAMVAELQQKLGGTAGTFAVTPWGGGGGTDAVSQLERLAKLHTKGALTDAEFAAEKAKIIGTSPPA